jgi:hypothetical protein
LVLRFEAAFLEELWLTLLPEVERTDPLFLFPPPPRWATDGTAKRSASENNRTGLVLSFICSS